MKCWSLVRAVRNLHAAPRWRVSPFFHSRNLSARAFHTSWGQFNLVTAKSIIPFLPKKHTPPVDIMEDLELLVKGQMDDLSIFREPLPLKDTLTPETIAVVDKAVQSTLDFLNTPRSPTSTPSDAAELQRLPTSLEEFFESKPRTIGNYNLLLRVIAEKRLPWEQGETVWKDLTTRGIEPNVYTFAHLFNILALSPSTKTRIGGQRSVTKALELFDKQLKLGLAPQVYTFSSLISVCRYAVDSKTAFELLEKMKKNHHLKPDAYCYNGLIHALLAEDKLERAWEVWRELQEQSTTLNEVLFNTVIQLCAETNDAEKALNLWDQMKFNRLQPNLYTYHSLMYTCVHRSDYYQKGFELFQELINMAYEPTATTFNILLHGCQLNRDLESANSLWKKMDELKVAKDAITYTTYMSVFAGIKKSVIEVKGIRVTSKERVMAVRHLLKDMDKKNFAVTNVALNTVLKACCNAMYSKLAENTLEEFKKRQLQPDVFTYMNLLRLWRRKRDVEKTKGVLMMMKEAKLPIPRQAYSLNLYTCKLKRDYHAGLEALKLMREAGFEPSAKEKSPWEKDAPKELPSWDRYLGSRHKGSGRKKAKKPLPGPPPRHIREKTSYRI